MTTYQHDAHNTRAWQPIQKPAEIVETRLIDAILNGTFPINSHLPGERELSETLGVTRPTLREALQRLSRDGWVDIHQGKATRVCDYWKEGNLGVLSTLAEHLDQLPDDFIPNLLNFRLANAPMYTALGVSNASDEVALLLEGRHDLDGTPQSFTKFDWGLQHQLTLLSNNPVFIMILNGFKDLFLNLAPYYFSIPEACQRSAKYYADLAKAAINKNVSGAKTLTEEIMRESLIYWQQTNFF